MLPEMPPPKNIEDQVLPAELDEQLPTPQLSPLATPKQKHAPTELVVQQEEAKKEDQTETLSESPIMAKPGYLGSRDERLGEGSERSFVVF